MLKKKKIEIKLTMLKNPWTIFYKSCYINILL